MRKQGGEVSTTRVAPVLGSGPGLGNWPAGFEREDLALEPCTSVYFNVGTPDFDGLGARFDQLKGAERLDAAIRLLDGSYPLPDAFGATIAANWEYLPRWRQASLLKTSWERCRCPEIESRLSQLASLPHSRVFDEAELQSIALARLYEFQPSRVREVVLADLARPRPFLTTHALFVLPDDTLSDFESLWTAILTGEVEGDPWKVSRLVERYASRALISLVPVIAEDDWPSSIQAALLGYWIKHDRAEGLKAVARGARRCDRSDTPTVFLRVLSRYWAADAEVLALGLLDDTREAVSVNAARALARHGSPSCLRRLREWAARRPLPLRRQIANAAFQQSRVRKLEGTK